MRNIAFASFAIIVLATPQIHASPVLTSHVAVRYGDLNLTSAQGRQVLRWRLKLAAHTVCGPEPDLRSLRFRPYQACVSGAVQRAMASVSRPLLADAGQ